MSGKKLTKREFLKLGFAGSAGVMALSGGFPLKAFAANVPGPSAPGKFSREAMFYTPTARGMKCLICPNECQIKPEEYGDCRTRYNHDGKLYTIAYGNPCAVHVDPVEKKPLYHFLPESTAFSIATAGCNLACLNCQNWEISQASPLDTRNMDLMPESVVEQAQQYGCRSIAYTYSDPVAFYEYTYDTAKIARLKGIKNILVSAGYINKEPLREWVQYVDAANMFQQRNLRNAQCRHVATGARYVEIFERQRCLAGNHQPDCPQLDGRHGDDQKDVRMAFGKRIFGNAVVFQPILSQIQAGTTARHSARNIGKSQRDRTQSRAFVCLYRQPSRYQCRKHLLSVVQKIVDRAKGIHHPEKRNHCRGKMPRVLSQNCRGVEISTLSFDDQFTATIKST